VQGLVEALSYVTDLVADQQTTIRDLRELLLGAALFHLKLQRDFSIG